MGYIVEGICLIFKGDPPECIRVLGEYDFVAMGKYSGMPIVFNSKAHNRVALEENESVQVHEDVDLTFFIRVGDVKLKHEETKW